MNTVEGKDSPSPESVTIALSFVRPLLREQKPIDIVFTRWGLDQDAVKAAILWLQVHEGLDPSYLEKEDPE